MDGNATVAARGDRDGERDQLLGLRVERAVAVLTCAERLKARDHPWIGLVKRRACTAADKKIVLPVLEHRWVPW